MGKTGFTWEKIALADIHNLIASHISMSDKSIRFRNLCSESISEYKKLEKDAFKIILEENEKEDNDDGIEILTEKNKLNMLINDTDLEYIIIKDFTKEEKKKFKASTSLDDFINKNYQEHVNKVVEIFNEKDKKYSL